MTTKEGFAMRLRQSINNSGKTIKCVAARCGTSRSRIRDWLNPHDPQMPNCRNLINLCLELHVSADYLLFGRK